MVLKRLMGPLLTVVALAGCSSADDCSSGAVIDVLDQEGREYIASWDSRFEATWKMAPSESVDIEFSEIRTLAHDESTSSFQCSAKIEATDSAGGAWDRVFSYVVYPVENADADFQVEYEVIVLQSAIADALNSRDRRLTEPLRREAGKQRLLDGLNKYRDGGDWGGEQTYAKALADEGYVIPPRTPQQQAKFGPPPLDFYGVPYPVPGGEIEMTPELAALQEQEAQVQAASRAEFERQQAEVQAGIAAARAEAEESRLRQEKERRELEEELRQRDEEADAALRSARGYGDMTDDQ